MKIITLLFFGLLLPECQILSQENEKILLIDSIVNSLSLDRSITSMSGCDTSYEAVGHSKQKVEYIHCTSVQLWGPGKKIVKLIDTRGDVFYKSHLVCFFDTLGNAIKIEYRTIVDGKLDSDRMIYVRNGNEILQTGTGQEIDTNNVLQDVHKIIEKIRPTYKFPNSR